MFDRLYLVVKNDDNQYRSFLNGVILEQEPHWSYSPEKAFPYGLYAFIEAKECGGKVYLRFPSGKEEEVCENDFK